MNDKQKKEETIHSLQVTLQHSQNLETILRFQKNDENVKKIADRNKNLSQQIDKLIVEMMQNWLADAQDATKKIKEANMNLQQAIANVNKKKNKAKNIVKAIGLVDDVISIATSLLPV